MSLATQVAAFGIASGRYSKHCAKSSIVLIASTRCLFCAIHPRAGFDIQENWSVIQESPHRHAPFVSD